MPFISDTAMQKVATKLQSFETREEKRKVEVRQKLNEAKVVAESSLGAALVGFMHGRFEDADANFFIPRTSIPAGAGASLCWSNALQSTKCQARTGRRCSESRRRRRCSRAACCILRWSPSSWCKSLRWVFRTIGSSST